MAARAIWISSSIQSIPLVVPTSRALAIKVPTMAASDANEDREPDRDGLPAGKHQPAQGADDEPDDDGADDGPGDGGHHHPEPPRGADPHPGQAGRAPTPPRRSSWSTTAPTTTPSRSWASGSPPCGSWTWATTWACAAVLRRDAFLQVGGFSPLLFVFGEETVLAYDLAAAGAVVGASVRDPAARTALAQRAPLPAPLERQVELLKAATSADA
jgi:hypothetical protein